MALPVSACQLLAQPSPADAAPSKRGAQPPQKTVSQTKPQLRVTVIQAGKNDLTCWPDLQRSSFDAMARENTSSTLNIPVVSEKKYSCRVALTYRYPICRQPLILSRDS